MKQHSLFAKPSVPGGKLPANKKFVNYSTQAENKQRVSDAIAGHVMGFLRKTGVGNEFRLRELEIFVMERVQCAPGSAGRILRDLRHEGRVNYELVSRSKSLYRVRG